MEKLIVLHLSSEKSWRGGEQQIAYLIEELAKSGVINHVAVRSGSAFETYCKDKGISFFSLPFTNSLDWKTAHAIKRICGEHNINVVHLHSSKSHGIGILSAVFGNTVPLILSRRVDFIPSRNLLTGWKYNHHAIKRILCVSDKVTKTMRTVVKDKDKCLTVYSGVDLNKFSAKPMGNILRQEYKVGEEFFLIGNTSALDADKDYFTYIDAIEILVNQKLPVKGFIIGTGALEHELKDYVLKKQLNESIIFTGFRTDIKNILPCLSFFLITTRMEGLGTSILDAFLAGVPVVATAVGGIPEMVIHQETGMLGAPGDAVEFASHLKTLIDNEELRQNLIAGALRKVKEFSKESTAKKTLDVYHEVAV